jgi:DNA polymerase III delta subunit
VVSIGSYTQWRVAADAGDLRRVTWVAGDQPILIEEVVDTTKKLLNVTDLDYVSLSYSTNYDREVWAHANQFSLTPGANRMILIRDAEKLTRWAHLEQWLGRTRQLPGVYLVFVTNEPDLPMHTVGGKKTLKPHVAALKAPRGSLVRCTQPNEADSVAWVCRRSRLDETIAKYLLTRTGGNLAATAAVCAKLELFAQKAGSATINALVQETPDTDFTDSLVALDKRRALLNIDALQVEDNFTLTALLDSRLDLLQKLHRMQIAGQSWREASGINPFLQRQYMPYARHYDPAACSRRRRVLAVIDDALRSGARDAVLHALVALW